MYNLFIRYDIFYPKLNYAINFQALLSLCYLCSSNIYALINYVGFATWVSNIYECYHHFSNCPIWNWKKELKVFNNFTILEWGSNILFSLNFSILKLLLLQVSIGLAVLCLPWLRWKHPEWQRPIKVNLIFPILYILATIYITIVPMIASPLETGKFKFNVNMNIFFFTKNQYRFQALVAPSFSLVFRFTSFSSGGKINQNSFKMLWVRFSAFSLIDWYGICDYF